jgi:hypothetical protein
MNTDPDPIENLMRRQDLTSPSSDLDRRVATTLHEQSAPSVIGRILASGGAAAAAACLVLVIWFTPDQSATQVGAISSPNTPSLPVRIEENRTETDLGEPVVLGATGLVLPMRQRKTRTVRWIDKEKNIRMEMTVPDQQVLYVALPID